MHPGDDLMLSYLDHSLSEDDVLKVEQHLQGCQICRVRRDKIQLSSTGVKSSLSYLDPNTAEVACRSQSAYQKFLNKEKITMSKRFQWRPAWVAVIIVAVLAVALTFEPMRAFASSFLNIFRVQQVTVLPLDLNSLKSPDGNPTLSQALRQMFTSSTQVTRPANEPQSVADAIEATQLAGFTVRVWQDKTPNVLRVESGTAFDFTVNLQQMRDVIQEAGLKGPDLPQELDGVKVSVNIPASVTAGYGDCKLPSNSRGTKPSGSSYSVQGANCIFLIQMPSPTLSTNPDVNTAQLAEIGLQFLGLKPEEAHNLSQSIDWTSTLVIPVPLGKVDYQKVDVDGVTGNLIHASVNSEQKPADTYNLIWIKDGILYTLSGVSDPHSAIDIANSLR